MKPGLSGQRRAADGIERGVRTDCAGTPDPQETSFRGIDSIQAGSRTVQVEEEVVASTPVRRSAAGFART